MQSTFRISPPTSNLTDNSACKDVKLDCSQLSGIPRFQTPSTNLPFLCCSPRVLTYCKKKHTDHKYKHNGGLLQN